MPLGPLGLGFSGSSRCVLSVQPTDPDSDIWFPRLRRKRVFRTGFQLKPASWAVICWWFGLRISSANQNERTACACEPSNQSPCERWDLEEYGWEGVDLLHYSCPGDVITLCPALFFGSPPRPGGHVTRRVAGQYSAVWMFVLL